MINSVSLALKLAKGLVIIDIIGDQEYLYNQNLSCMTCNISYENLEPRNFSFNSPIGACPKCEGLGAIMKIDIDKIIPDKRKSLIQGCLVPFGEQPGKYKLGDILRILSRELNFSYSISTIFC